MIRKIVIWLLIVVGVAIIVVVVAGYMMVSKVEKRLSTVYDIEPVLITIPDDSLSLEKGKRFATALCSGCHAEDLGGRYLINNDDIGQIITPNITSGRGGMVQAYRDIDWIRTIRHGVKPTGMPLLVMPSIDFQHLSDEDLGATIAYLKTVEPVDREWPLEHDVTTMAKILLQMGAFGPGVSAEFVEHGPMDRMAPPAGVTVEYGSYLQDVCGCITCHGPDLNGGYDPNPEAPPGPNLTPGGNLANWTKAQFIQTIRTGKTPEGKVMKTEYMPWKSFSGFNDEELSALFVYLQSLPAMESAID